MVNKLHRQFCHCSSNKLKQLIKSSQLWKDDPEVLIIVDEISSKCNVCKMYKKTPLRPVVGLPLASEFNHTVAMDLITIQQGVWILHLVDVFSRYSVACVRRSKKPSTIIEAIFKTWISYFGRPQRFLADNGGEFANEEYREMCESFSIDVAKTAAESPWSNGLCERHNGVLKQSVKKVIEDTNCSLETAVSWAVSAKNTLHGHNGYSPNMIVFGRNPNMPGVPDDKLPALEEVSSITVERNLAAMRSAREAFIQSESSEKIKRALKSKVRSFNDARFQNGDRVYYKRNDSDKWKGPGSVIGQENKQVLVKHGSEYVRVHISRLIHIDNVDFNPVMSSEDKKDSTQVLTEDTDCPSEECLPGTDNVSDKDHTDTTVCREDVLEAENVTNATRSNNVESQGDIETAEKQPLPKIKSTILYRLKGEDQWREGTVHSHAGKAKGKYQNCLNMKNKEGEVQWFDFSTDIEEWEPVCEEVLLTNNLEKDSVQVAKQKELESWKANNVYEEVGDEGQHSISCRWVITSKVVKGTAVTKARLVARGFEDAEIGDRQTDSPTCSRESIRLVLSMIASKKWKCNMMDVKTAFLQGKPLERDIYIKPPKEAKTSGLWKLKKCVYGLNEASRYWYNRVTDELAKLGLVKSKYDEALFYWRHEGRCEGVLVIHVDDFLYGGSTKFENLIQNMKTIFTVGSEETVPMKYLGMNIDESDGDIYFSQDSYIDSMEEVEIQKKTDKSRVLNEDEQALFRKICGQLNWISTQSRPDIAFDVCQLSTRLNTATVQDILQANKVLRKVKQNRFSLKYVALKQPWKLVVYCDASYANLKDGSSQGGMIIFLVDGEGRASPIAWISKKLRRVCRSTIAAETMSLLDAVDTSVWLSHLLDELKDKQLHTTEIYTDNMSLTEAVHSTKAMEEKRLRVDIAALRESVKRKEITVNWVDTKSQLADVFTKQGVNTQTLIDTLKCGQI